jgi:hypothetical protein
MRFQSAIVLGILIAPGMTGCVSSSYQYGVLRPQRGAVPTSPQVESGRPNALIDGVGWVVGIPGKILLWDRRVDSHHISPGTEQAISEYLVKNDLGQTKVRLNQYDPLGEWRRLTENKQVGAGWRYTLGSLTTLGYTILPGRVFGGDHYNPFTNTINVYSDHPAIALHEGGHAKDIRSRELPGTYSAAYMLPFVALWHEEKATSDVLSYLNAEDRHEEMREAYKILYPAYGTHVAGQFNNFIPPPFDLAVTAVCVIPGHVAGRIKATQVQGRETLADANPFEASPLAEMNYEVVPTQAPVRSVLEGATYTRDLD